MSIYSDKLAHVQVVINSRYSVAQMCTWEDTHARLFEQDFESSHCHHLLYVAISQKIQESVVSIYSDKLAYVQVIINSQYI